MNAATEKRPIPTVPEIISIQGLAHLWQVKPDSLRRMARDGTLPSVKLGRKTMIRLDALREMFDENGTPNTKA